MSAMLASAMLDPRLTWSIATVLSTLVLVAAAALVYFGVKVLVYATVKLLAAFLRATRR